MELFCYGSLEFAQVMRAVTGRAFAAEPATLADFARYRVKDDSYPGLVPEAGARTEGTLYRDLDAAALSVLDRFEGEFYERQTREVELHDGRHVPAQVYVVVATRRDALSREAWDKAHFERVELAAFMRRLPAR